MAKAKEKMRISSGISDKARQLYISCADATFDLPLVGLLVVAEWILCRIIIFKVPYTEIDWEAYMQEVEMWQLEGELDYRKIRGSTGPLVYPAGFLYLYGWLRRVTQDGTDIAAAQRIFSHFYSAMIGTVLYLYTRVARRAVTRIAAAATPPTQQQQSFRMMQQAHCIWSWRLAMLACCLSKRLHSIFVLRLFNDGPAMLLLYLSVALFCSSSWRWGCVLYSLAVGIKMNVLLFAPGLLLLLLQSSPNLQECIVRLGICALVQLVLGAPFLTAHPVSYLRKAFEFDRVFFYKWTVNWKFLQEELFLSKPLSVALLLLHLTVLAYLAVCWLQSAKAQMGKRLFLGDLRHRRRLCPDYVVYTMFLSNFVGICFARTLHYQFYAWYCSTVPLLLWTCLTYPVAVRVAILAAMEYAFLVFPATPWSSAVLQLAHATTLVGMRSPQAIQMTISEEDDTKSRKQS